MTSPTAMGQPWPREWYWTTHLSLMQRLLEKYRIVVLLAMVALSSSLRVKGLNAVSFSENEAHKLEAARAYLHGDFLVNLAC